MSDCAGFRELLPSNVEVEQVPGNLAQASLCVDEHPLIAQARPDRLAEFATTRHCARLALARLGYPPQAILSGSDREPVWPAGIVGSLTHCHGVRAAAVASAASTLSLGIDAEPNESLSSGILRVVASDQERAALRRLESAYPGVAWDRILFSAKEATFKSWFPVTRRWLDFTEYVLTIDEEANTWRGRLLVDDERLGLFGAEEISGRWGVYGEHVLTAVHVEAP